jgi:hypothetical protein
MNNNNAPSIIAIPKGKGWKKQIRETLQEKLAQTLADYKPVIGEKKFDDRIRKTARLFREDIVKSIPKKQKKEKLNGQAALG